MRRRNILKCARQSLGMVKRKTKATTVRFHDKQLQRVYEEAREAFQRAGITLEDVLEWFP